MGTPTSNKLNGLPAPPTTSAATMIDVKTCTTSTATAIMTITTTAMTATTAKMTVSPGVMTA